MKADTPIDYAVFQLSPRRSHCELFVSSDGNTEKLASGSVKPFVTHLKVAEEQVARAVQSVKLEVGKRDNAETWFTKGTLERFVRFVSTPEVLEIVNTFDAEMSQLEAARKIYSQGTREQLSGALGGDGTTTTAEADETKKGLLRAIDVRLVAARQDLTTAYGRAVSAGFNSETVPELQHFADRFGAHRLNDACTKFILVCQRRPDLISPWKPGVNDQVVRASWGSDMSLDDPTEDQGWPHQPSQYNKPHNTSSGQVQQQQLDTAQTQHHLSQSKPSTCQQPKSTLPTQQQHQQRSQNENNDEEKKKEAVTESSLTNPPSRRLSVQDRINLFENKQKESSSGSGGKTVVVGKSTELRRLSSDVSLSSTNNTPASASVSASTPTGTAVIERAVLRRWSGASDMSIDLGNERKENNSIDSPLCTPSSSSVSHPQSNVFSGLSEDNKDRKDHKGLNDSASSVKVEAKSGGNRGGDDSGVKDQVRVGGFLVKEEEVRLKVGKNWKDQVGSDRTEQVHVGDQGVSQEKLKGSFVGGEKSDPFKVQSGSEDADGVKHQATLRTQIGSSVGRPGAFTSDDEIVNNVQDLELIDQQPVPQSRFRGSQSHSRSHSQSLSGQFEGGIGIKVKEAWDKGSQGDQLTSQRQWRSFTGDVEESGKDFMPIKAEESGTQKMKFQKPAAAAAPEQIKKLQGKRDESSPVYGNNKPLFQGKKALESQESFGAVPTPPVEQVQRSRQSKGNQELNDELKLKANELEKLFAEHKLRVPGDQSSSTRRSKPADAQNEQAVSSQYRKPTLSEISPAQLPGKTTMNEPSGSSSNMTKFSTPPSMKMVDNQDFSDTRRQSFSEHGFSDDSRGKFYETYMQKRDAKLREEWSSKRGEKEAKLKAMQDSLEQSRAEMTAKFSGFTDKQDTVASARRRAEKLRSFNFQSNMKMEQHPISSIQSEEDEDLSEIWEQKYFGQERSFTETSFGDNASKSFQSKKLLPNRSLSSTTPRTAAPMSRSSAKISNSASGRRRPQSENPLAQSVPNFSDLRKENTKPYSGVGKVTTRSQVRNNPRSKASSEEIPLVKEEKPRRSNSLRKNSSGPVEFSDMPPLDSDGVVLASLKFDKEQSVESKPFLRKGNGIGPGAGASIAKLKASLAADALTNEEEFDEFFEAEDSADVAKDDEEELETMETEESIDMDNGKPRLSHESDKLGNSGSENGDSLRSLSQADLDSVAELPAAVPSAFQAGRTLQDSPGESPVSWNSRMHHPFSYPHDTSDIDASVDSPIGSPASWNSHSLNQTEADAARMRKKWGSAQKPFIASNSSHNQSRKDVTKGFKRLLKFGRKSRGTDNMVDWISATTSEGDDDTEDGRDPANRSSEDLGKSRMGFSQSHPSDDGFNESDLFNEQVQALQSSIPAPPANFKLREDHMSGSSMKAPRSFFSLSSFRSKGSDSKLR